MPRARAQVRKANYAIATPDMSDIGDFDLHSSQPWIRSPEAWIERERKFIWLNAVLNLI